MSEILDKKDWKILGEVCDNARMSHSKIAKKVALSKNAVSYRIDRLAKAGIISGFFSIIDHNLLGLSFYEVLLRINAGREREHEIVAYLKNHPNLLVLDRLSGEWNFVMEFGFRKIEDFHKAMNDLKNKFSGVIDVFEVHPISYGYKVEQLPVELVKLHPEVRLKEVKQFARNEKTFEADELDKKLLYELNKNSTTPLYVLAKTLGITAETVSDRIKKLKQQNVILKFTAKINLRVLGYDSYLIILSVRNLSSTKETAIRKYIVNHKKIRYAFMSASRPMIFIYFAAKNTDDVDTFLTLTKENFSDVIINQSYLLLREQYKYELFPQGFL